MSSFEDTGGNFFLDVDGKILDLISDDQALWLKTSKGLVVVLGCAYSGVVNTLNYISKLTGACTFHAVIGGMHLGKVGLERWTATAETLTRYEVSLVVPMHCTGTQAATFLAKHLSGRVQPCGAGEKIVI